MRLETSLALLAALAAFGSCVFLLVRALAHLHHITTTSRQLDRLLSSLPRRAAVVRQGRMRSVRACGLVPGDVVVVAAGDVVPADLLVIYHTHDFLSTDTIPELPNCPLKIRLTMTTVDCVSSLAAQRAAALSRRDVLGSRCDSRTGSVSRASGHHHPQPLPSFATTTVPMSARCLRRNCLWCDPWRAFGAAPPAQLLHSTDFKLVRSGVDTPQAAFMGTRVIAGTAYGVVAAVGDDTSVGAWLSALEGTSQHSTDALLDSKSASDNPSRLTVGSCRDLLDIVAAASACFVRAFLVLFLALSALVVLASVRITADTTVAGCASASGSELTSFHHAHSHCSSLWWA